MIWISLAYAADVTLSPGDDVATLTAALQPGDVVNFEPGTYTLPYTVTWTGLGTADAPIILRGPDAVLELADGWAVAYVNASTFLEIDGLTFRTAATYAESHSGLVIEDSSDINLHDAEIGAITGTGLYLSGDNARITVSDVHIHDTGGNGVYMGCGDASCWTEASTFERLWIHDVGADRTAFELDPGCQGNTLRDSVIYRSGGYGLVTDSTEYGERNVIEGNAIWETTATAVYIRGSTLFRNNIVFNAGGNGLLLTDGDRGTLQDSVVSFNTVADTVEESVEIHDWAGYTGMVFANNVIANPTGRALAFNETGHDDTTLLRNNVVTGLVDGLSPTYTGTAVVDGAGYHDFVDAEGWNFYPTSGGIMVDAGDPSAEVYVPDTDFNGAPREGDTPDAGAYEREGDTNPGWALQEGFKDLDAYGAAAPEVQGGCCADKESGAAWILGLWGLGLLRRRR